MHFERTYRGLELNCIEANNGQYYTFSNVGVIISSILDENSMSSSYLLCDGRSCVGTAYSRLTGNNTVPDLRDRFLRGASVSANVGTYRNHTTSSNDLSATLLDSGAHTHSGLAEPTGAHTHSYQRLRPDTLFLFDEGSLGFGGSIQDLTSSSGSHTHALTYSPSGEHTHSITLSGGDLETAPINVGLNFFIKVN
jgi:hypothetical protein